MPIPKRKHTSAPYSHILRECADVADERAAQYGDVHKNFEDISDIANAMFGLQLSITDVAKIMIATKWARQRHKPKKDNLIDAMNYTAILAALSEI